MELVREVGPQKAVRGDCGDLGEGLPVEVARRVLALSVSGHYAWRRRPPAARTIRHAWLSDVIRLGA